MQPMQEKYSNKVLPLIVGLIAAGQAFAAVEIVHNPIEESKSGRRIGVEAEVLIPEGNDSVREVRAYFRTDQDGRWHYVPMHPDGDDYSGVMPAPDVHTSFVRYQLLSITDQRELTKSQIFNIQIEKDDKALKRLQSQEPRDVRIDVSDLQDAEEIYERLEKASDADKQNLARESGRPDPDSRVDVRSEQNPATDALNGFDDYVNITYTGATKAFGTAAGIVSTNTATTAVAPNVAGVSTVTAAGAAGGSVLPWVLGGVAVAGGAAAAGGGSSDSGSSGGGTGGGGGGGTTVTDFAGRTTGPNTCSATGNAAFRWVVDLNQTGADITGVITFHDCPGGGRAEYDVTGTATSDPTVTLEGVVTFTAGPLGGTAPANQTFTVSPGGAPDPNFAP